MTNGSSRHALAWATSNTRDEQPDDQAAGARAGTVASRARGEAVAPGAGKRVSGGGVPGPVLASRRARQAMNTTSRGERMGRVQHSGRAFAAPQILAQGGGKLAIPERASCGRLRAHTPHWRMGMNPTLGIHEAASFASWRHGVRKSPSHASRNPCMRRLGLSSRHDARRTCLFKPPSAQREARTGHPRSARARIRGRPAVWRRPMRRGSVGTGTRPRTSAEISRPRPLT